MELESQRHISLDELADHCNIPGGKKGIFYAGMILSESMSQVESIDQGLEDGEYELKRDLLESNEPEPDEKMINEDEKAYMRKMIAGLDKRKAKILKMYYGFNGHEPMTLQEIGEIMNLSRERVRQLKNETLGRLSEILRRGKTE